LFVDLADLHGNTRDGVHVASAGGVWGTVVFGFAGLFESGTSISFDPRLPDTWSAMSLRVQRHGSRMVVDLDNTGCTVRVLSGDPVLIHTTAGITGLLPESEGEDTHHSGRDADRVDEVVLVEAGHSIRIDSASSS